MADCPLLGLGRLELCLLVLGRLAPGRFVGRRCRLCLCHRALCLARDDAIFLHRSPLVCPRLEAGLLGSDDSGLPLLFLRRLAGRLGCLLGVFDRLDRRLLFLLRRVSSVLMAEVLSAFSPLGAASVGFSAFLTVLVILLGQPLELNRVLLGPALDSAEAFA